MANAKYNYEFFAGKPLGGDTDNSHSYMSFNIDLVFMSYKEFLHVRLNFPCIFIL